MLAVGAGGSCLTIFVVIVCLFLLVFGFCRPSIPSHSSSLWETP